VRYAIVYTKAAKKDIPKLKAAGLDQKAEAYARRISIQHRLVYQVYEDVKTVKIVSMWSHYEF